METQEISIENLLSIIEEKDRKIAELEQQIKWFMSQIRLSRHKQFGVSSEQTNATQISIFNEAESNADLSVPEPKLTEVRHIIANGHALQRTSFRRTSPLR